LLFGCCRREHICTALSSSHDIQCQDKHVTITTREHVHCERAKRVAGRSYIATACHAKTTCYHRAGTPVCF
jgi:hypothetical protein